MKIAPAQSVLPLYRDDACALFDAEMALLKWRELPIGVGERKFNPTEVHQAHLLAQEFGEDGLSANSPNFPMLALGRPGMSQRQSSPGGLDWTRSIHGDNSTRRPPWRRRADPTPGGEL